MLHAIPSTLMRGGTSKGLYFHAKDLPQSARARDRALLAAMGSPDARQIDGVGGAHPLTSKVAIIGPSKRPDADVDYLFLQVVVEKAEVSDSQNCGNILAGVGPRMNLGDVARKTVPKMCLVSPARHAGTIHTRTFIPHRVHEAIGVLGAVSVATACVTPGSVAAQVAGLASGSGPQRLEIEHPTGFFTVEMDVTVRGATVTRNRPALLRPARKLMQGEVFF